MQQNYRFTGATYRDAFGNVKPIPDGIWPVTVLSIVTVVVGGRVMDMDTSQWSQLKLDGKVVLIS